MPVGWEDVSAGHCPVPRVSRSFSVTVVGKTASSFLAPRVSPRLPHRRAGAPGADGGGHRRPGQGFGHAPGLGVVTIDMWSATVHQPTYGYRP